MPDEYSYVPTLPEAEPRLQSRYNQLVVAHLSNSQRLAAGLHPPPSLVRPFAAVQAAWRFYSNNRVGLPELSAPLIECARADLDATCEDWMLVAFDWCNIHFCSHEHRMDRVPLAHTKDLGYELLTALAVGDREGCPIAPLCLDLRASDGVHSTRSKGLLAPVSNPDETFETPGEILVLRVNDVHPSERFSKQTVSPHEISQSSQTNPSLLPCQEPGEFFRDQPP